MATWLLTNTTYGTWLPGDRRGSVTSVRDCRPGDLPSSSRIEHDVPGTLWESPHAGLHRSATALLKGPPVRLTGDQAAALLVQFEETARHRSWSLSAAAIMANHFHLVVAAADEVAPERMLIDFKAYGTRILNRLFGPRPGGTWWTSGGSKRRLPNDRAVERAVEYVTRQRYPLVVWTPRQA